MASAATELDETAVTHGYRSVWRWHFYAALWTAPLLIVLTLTGAIYLFDREFDGWWNRRQVPERPRREVRLRRRQRKRYRPALRVPS